MQNTLENHCVTALVLWHQQTPKSLGRLVKSGCSGTPCLKWSLRIAFLTSSRVTLRLLVQGPHWEPMSWRSEHRAVVINPDCTPVAWSPHLRRSWSKWPRVGPGHREYLNLRCTSKAENHRVKCFLAFLKLWNYYPTLYILRVYLLKTMCSWKHHFISVILR